MFKLLTFAPADTNGIGGTRSSPVAVFRTCKSPSLPIARNAPGRPKPGSKQARIGGGTGRAAGVTGPATRRKPPPRPEAVLLPGIAKAAVNPPEQDARLSSLAACAFEDNCTFQINRFKSASQNKRY